jgi:hypothetical protein
VDGVAWLGRAVRVQRWAVQPGESSAGRATTGSVRMTERSSTSHEWTRAGKATTSCVAARSSAPAEQRSGSKLSMERSKGRIAEGRAWRLSGGCTEDRTAI